MSNSSSSSNNKKKSLFQELKEAFMEGYNRNKKDKSSSSLIVTEPSKEEILLEIRKFETELLFKRIEQIEQKLSFLQHVINDFVAKEEEKQELMVNLTTMVEEVVHSMEELGVVSENELPKIELNSKAPKDDFMQKTSGYKAAVPKKYDLN